MSKQRDVAVENVNTAIKMINGIVETSKPNLQVSDSVMAVSSAFTLISISQHLDRIATALESKD